MIGLLSTLWWNDRPKVAGATDHVDKNVGGDRNFDVKYAMDGLDRLLDADEGSLVTGSITSRLRREFWTLSQTGNWHANPLDLDGDGAYTSVGDRVLTAHAYSKANEWTSRTFASGTGSGTSSAMYAGTHDAVGNQIDDGEDFEYVYDPFGRLRFVKRTDNQAVVAEYRYNGLGFRVGWHYDVDADGTVENTADDPWFFFAYDEGWRMVATYRSTDSSPKEQFVHHMAGLGGFGGSSYIDGVILRERDANTTWASAADGTLEERLYYVQNWRADVVAIVTSAGKLVERARYSAYGIPTAFPAGDTDCDGDWDAADSADIGSNYTPGSAYAVRRDADLDGDVDAADVTHANSITGGYQSLGRDVLTSAAVRNRIGYAGYQYDPTFAGVDRHLYHVRHRVYDAELGRWTRRDPLGYVDGMGLYEYTSGAPLILRDPLGLCRDPVHCTDSAVQGASQVPHGAWCVAYPEQRFAFLPVPGTAWPISPFPSPGCWAEYKAAELFCELLYPPGPNLTRCLEIANFKYQLCLAKSRLPFDIPLWSDCVWGITALPIVPLPPTLATCNWYGACWSHYGINFRCMCMCTGAGAWPNYVRSCIRCAIGKGVHPFTAHAMCWAEATRRFGAPPATRLLLCGAICRAHQIATCGGEIETY